jgi:Na+-transporting methylmalonyl-CoA/oxaloacetate decarboxylase gamma subunit
MRIGRLLKCFPLTLTVSGIALILLNLALFIFFMSPYMEEYQRHDNPLVVAIR